MAKKLERKIQQLESTIQEMESEDLDLDAVVDHYQDAIKTAKEVWTLLKETETKISILNTEAEQILKTDQTT